MRTHEILGGAMRRNVLGVLGAVCGLILAVNAMAGQAAGTGINQSAHDLPFNNYTAEPPDTALAGSGPRICIYCHAPHNTYKLSPANLGPAFDSNLTAPDPFTYLPLWNHQLTDNYAAYTMYFPGPGRPTTGPRALQAFNAMTPGSSSLLCLSCHDGSVAVNAYGNSSQKLSSVSVGSHFIQSAAYIIGENNYLGNHHPIGFNYNAVSAVDNEAVGGIRDAGIATMGSAGTVADHLYNSKMECGTCHAVHNTGNTGESLLWRSDASSRLCLTCHAKGDNPGQTVP
jgi:predicted CXXCH cytochrome family protein